MAALKVVLPGVLVPHRLPADLADVAAGPVDILPQVVVGQILQEGLVLQTPLQTCNKSHSSNIQAVDLTSRHKHKDLSLAQTRVKKYYVF